MSCDPHVVIVGAGHAGGSLAAQLRQWGHRGAITLIGEEPIAPYHRPPLSKAYMKDAVGEEALKLRPDNFYADNEVTLRLGTRVATIDRTARTVSFEGGGHAEYDLLVLATGSRARDLPVPGAGLENVHRLRSLADAERLKREIGPGRSVAVVGGGYVGLEVAASAIELGSKVTVLEREARVLARVASSPLSDFFRNLHAARGVEILCDATVSAFVGDKHGYVREVALADGRRVRCDVAVVGIGAQCCDELARAAGLDCENGIVVDAEARTSDAAIFAIGDATWRPLGVYGGLMARLESVPNALEQAKQAASAILGRPPPAPEVPWFWSDQYDRKLQIAGLPLDAGTAVIRGEPKSGSFAVFHLSDGQLRAVEAVNAPAEFMAGRQMIGRCASVNPQRLADTGFSMKELASAS